MLAIVCLLLAGCGKFDAVLTVEGDHASGTYTMAVSNDLAAQSGVDASRLWNAVAGYLANKLPAQIVATPDPEPGFTGSVYTFADQPLDQIPLLTSGYLKIAQQGDTYTASGSIDLTDLDTAMRQQGFPDTLINGLATQVTITFPGPVTSANGSISGNSVTWHPLIGTDNVMAAVAQASPGATPISSTTTRASVPTIEAPSPTAIPTIELPAIDGLLTDRPVLDLGASSAPGWTKWIPQVLIGSCAVVGLAAIMAAIARRSSRKSASEADELVG